ncbi:MAG: SDR family oxidoreductase [Firmicutes bacterium]|nr:SDR family oxidoreductase [Bacillota bacterium]
MDLGLKGKVILVTGAGQGIGLALGRFLAQEGASVAFHYHTSRAGAEEAAREAERLGSPAMAIAADLRRPTAITQMVAAVEEQLGAVYALVNNAAFTKVHPFLETQEDDLREEFDATVFGTMMLTRAVLERMVPRGRGSVVTVVGEAGRVGESRLAVTAAARAAEVAFAKSIAKEFGRHGIRSNVVSLGLIEKPDKPMHVDPSRVDQIRRLYPMGRLGRVEDVPPLVALLCSELTDWVTGQVWAINGGYTMV